MNRWKILLFFNLCCFLQAIEIDQNYSHLLKTQIEKDSEEPEKTTQKKYQLSICAIFKNESLHLKEWIEYHRLIGVDHFYLYNIRSSDQFSKILNSYVKEGLVTVINWIDCRKEAHQPFVWPLTTKISAYENARLFLSEETKWLCFLDIEEFLVPSPTLSLVDLLEKYEGNPAIILSSDHFDASKMDKLGHQRLLIEAVDFSKAPQESVHEKVEKMLFKPEYSQGFELEPYLCRFKEGHVPIRVKKSELRVNRYLNRNWYVDFGKIKKKLHIDSYILTEDEKFALLEEDYAIKDCEKVIYHYVPDLRKKMGYSTVWD